MSREQLLNSLLVKFPSNNNKEITSQTLRDYLAELINGLIPLFYDARLIVHRDADDNPGISFDCSDEILPTDKIYLYRHGVKLRSLRDNSGTHPSRVRAKRRKYWRLSKSSLYTPLQNFPDYFYLTEESKILRMVTRGGQDVDVYEFSDNNTIAMLFAQQIGDIGGYPAYAVTHKRKATLLSHGLIGAEKLQRKTSRIFAFQIERTLSVGEVVRSAKLPFKINYQIGFDHTLIATFEPLPSNF